MAELTESDLADFAERFIDTPWAVYIQGVDQVLTCPCLCLPHQRCGRPFTRESALQFAESIVRDAQIATAFHGVDPITVIPYVLHHGVVWTER